MSTSAAHHHPASSSPKFELYAFWRSGPSWRVRLALELKGLPYTIHPINLLNGEQDAPGYEHINPNNFVPTLAIHHGTDNTHTKYLSQSIAIIEYLEEAYTHTTRLMPTDPMSRAVVRQLVLMIACDTSPIVNRWVQVKLAQFTGKEEDKEKWAHDIIHKGLTAVERALTTSAGKYCVGDQITVADLCLVPQMYGARRFKVDVSAFPTCVRIDETLKQHPAFLKAHPDVQPDNPDRKQ